MMAGGKGGEKRGAAGGGGGASKITREACGQTKKRSTRIDPGLL